jgi:UPF0716 protein FxsA
VGRLFLLFTLVPLLELYLLLTLGRLMGVQATVLLVLVTGLLGAALARREGLRVLGQYREALSQGRLPEEGILGGVLVLVGGVLLVTPGVLTDVLGLALLFPPTRRALANLVRRRLEKGLRKGTVRAVGFGFGGFGRPPPGPPVIEAEPEQASEERWDELSRRRGTASDEADAELVDDPRDR